VPSVDVQHELAAIFERLDHIEREIDQVEAELRARAREIANVPPPEPPADH
jgi:tetrahydromethanopterin S-methyltransferase subunit G